jgi:hypothetical protein
MQKTFVRTAIAAVLSMALATLGAGDALPAGLKPK